jgi:hypothetical protein
MLNDLANPLAIVAHDAGAANHLIAWIQAAGAAGPALRPCLAGPALALWQRAGLGPTLALEEALDGAGALLSGTGWASDLEHMARRLARQRGLRSVAVIDHWTNYRSRFERAGEVVLPDEIWVADAEAAALARAAFGAVPVRQQPNLYLAAQVAAVHAAEVRRLEGGAAPRTGGTRVLYVLEPIRDAWGALAEPGEFAALDFFVSRLPALGLGAGDPIRLRPHPSDPPGKYDAWLARHSLLDVALDGHAGLAEALAWADTVAGCQTYAMVVALAAGRRVVSTVPPWAPACVLPQSGIVHLSVPTPHAAVKRHASTTQVLP